MYIYQSVSLVCFEAVYKNAIIYTYFKRKSYIKVYTKQNCECQALIFIPKQTKQKTCSLNVHIVLVGGLVRRVQCALFVVHVSRLIHVILLVVVVLVLLLVVVIVLFLIALAQGSAADRWLLLLPLKLSHAGLVQQLLRGSTGRRCRQQRSAVLLDERRRRTQRGRQQIVGVLVILVVVVRGE